MGQQSSQVVSFHSEAESLAQRDAVIAVSREDWYTYTSYQSSPPSLNFDILCTIISFLDHPSLGSVTRVNRQMGHEAAKRFWRSCIIESLSDQSDQSPDAAHHHIERGAAFISRPDRAPYVRSLTLDWEVDSTCHSDSDAEGVDAETRRCAAIISLVDALQHTTNLIALRIYFTGHNGMDHILFARTLASRRRIIPELRLFVHTLNVPGASLTDFWATHPKIQKLQSYSLHEQDMAPVPLPSLQHLCMGRNDISISHSKFARGNSISHITWPSPQAYGLCFNFADISASASHIYQLDFVFFQPLCLTPSVAIILSMPELRRIHLWYHPDMVYLHDKVIVECFQVLEKLNEITWSWSGGSDVVERGGNLFDRCSTWCPALRRVTLFMRRRDYAQGTMQVYTRPDIKTKWDMENTTIAVEDMPYPCRESEPIGKSRSPTNV